MDPTDTKYINNLSPFLENGTLHHIIKHFDNNSENSLLVIKKLTFCKFLTNKEHAQFIEINCIDLCNTDGIKNCMSENKFKTYIFICICTENIEEFGNLTYNLPQWCFYDLRSTYFWDSNRCLTTSLFIESVENLLSIVYLKPAKRS
jgi:hypothetical protein